MGKFLGIPEWLAITLYLVSSLIVFFAYAAWKHRRQMQKLAKARPSIDRAEFVKLLSASVDPEIAEWMWDTLTPYYRPLTPHPDDDLIQDAWIDDDDIAMDWLPAFAKERGLRWQDWPKWPPEWQVTPMNYARWLQLGLA